LWAETVVDVADAASARGWGVVDVARSPLPGPSGNVEFFLWLRAGPSRMSGSDIARAVRGEAETEVPDEKVDP
jgi:23S rRNA (cytidine1920-2'-O)/16S rRNA (cytidine1409-2'-O)-methyltransferase